MSRGATAARGLALGVLLALSAPAAGQDAQPQPEPYPYPPGSGPPPQPGATPSAPSQPGPSQPSPAPPAASAPQPPAPAAAQAPASPPQPAPPARTAQTPASPAPTASAPGRTASPPAAGGTASAAQTAPLPAVTPPAAAATGGSTVPPSPASALGGAVPGASGTEDRRVHALERTLVERGGLLLDPGRFELVPEIGYAVSDHDAVLGANGTVVAAQTRRFGGGITLRLGLPLRFQAEVAVPFTYLQETPQPPPGATAASRSGGGLGDIRLALTWHVLRSAGAFPDVLVNGFYKTRSGSSPLDASPAAVPLGSGIVQFGGGLSLVKALDPVVLLVGASASESVPREVGSRWFDTRSALAITTSVILAVSPETSLSFGLEQAYSQDVQVDRRDVPGTSRTAAVFDVGFATLASRAGLLQVTLGIGLTDDVPRFQLGLAAPLQF